MRAARLLQILLLLQNRGRLTAARLAEELEVTPRTILRDVDAMTEAGLPIIVVQGYRGGIELGFNYRTRLTGLDRAEAEALGVLLAAPHPGMAAIGLADAARHGVAKLIESLPDRSRDIAARAASQFRLSQSPVPDDPRLPALAMAVREARVIRIRARSPAPHTVHPTALGYAPAGWHLTCARSGTDIALSDCGDINISRQSFA